MGLRGFASIYVYVFTLQRIRTGIVKTPASVENTGPLRLVFPVPRKPAL